MAITLFPLRRLSVGEEPNGSFAETLTAGAFLPVPAVAGSMEWTPGQEMLNPDILQQYAHGMSLQVLGPRRGSTLSFTVPLFTTGTLANASTTSLTRAASAGLLLLDMAFGGLRGGQAGSTVATGISAAGFTVASGHGSRFAAGGALMRVATNGRTEMREIRTVSTDTITLEQGFSETPSASDVIYNCVTVYPDRKASPTSMQFLAEGEEADDYWRLSGCMPASISLELGYGSIPSIRYEMQVAEWAYLGSGTLAAQTYSNFNPLAFNSGELLCQTIGTLTRRVVSHRSFSASTQLTYLPVESPEGTQGRIGYTHNHTPPFATANVGTFYEDQTWHTDRTNRNRKHLAMQMGMSASGGVLLTMPSAQVTELSAPQDGEGLTGQDITLVSLLDASKASQSTALLRAPLRLHIGG